MSSVRQLQRQMAASKKEIASLRNDLLEIGKQRAVADELTQEKLEEQAALERKYDEVAHKLHVTNVEFNELEKELLALQEEEIDPAVKALESTVRSIVGRSVEQIRQRRDQEFSLQLAMLKLEATGAAQRIGHGADSIGSDTQLLSRVAVEFGSYACIINLAQGATFEDVVAEAAHYWNIGAEGVFLQGPEGAIYPQTAVVATAVPAAVIDQSSPVVEAPADGAAVRPPNANDNLVGVVAPGEHLPPGTVRFKLRRPRLAVNRMRLAERRADERRMRDARAARKRAKEEERRREAMAAARQERVVERLSERKSSLVRELSLHVIFTTLVLIALLAKRSVTDAYHMSSTARQALVDRQFVSRAEAVRGAFPYTVNFTTPDQATRDYHTVTFRSISRHAEFWQWLTGPLTYTIFPDPFGNKTGPVLTYNRLVGGVRLRQVRVRQDYKCEVSSRATDLVKHCYPPYSEDTRSTSPYNDLTSPGFVFTPKEQVVLGDGQDTYNGQLARYDPSGFLVELSGDRREWLQRVQALFRGSWLDFQTRAVFVTFNLYNANLDLYLSAMLLFEQSLAGAMITSFDFSTVELGTCVLCSPLAILENLINLMVIVLIAGIVLRVRATVYVYGRPNEYFSNPWNWCDIAIFGLFVTSGSIRIAMLVRNNFLESRLWASSGYIDLRDEAYFYQLAYRLDSLVAFACIVKLFKFLRLLRRMEQFIRVFVRAGVEITLFAVLFLGTFMGFVILAHEIYGTEMRDFADLVRSTRTLLKMMVGTFDYERMRLVDQTWTPVFFFLFIAFVVLVMVNVFLAILNETYTSVREELTEEEERLRRIKAMQPRRVRNLRSLFGFLAKTFHPRSIFSIDLHKREIQDEVLDEAAIELQMAQHGAGPLLTAREEKETFARAKQSMGTANPNVV